MPITPQFNLSQTPTHVVLDVFVPHIRISGIQVVLEEDQSIFHFAAPPIYVLVLNFAPHRFARDQQDDETGTLEPIHGRVHVELEKYTAGEHWDNLDLLGKLVAGSRRTNSRETITAKWLQQVVSHETTVEEAVADIDEKMHGDVNGNSSLGGSTTIDSSLGYGFARIYHDVFTDLTRDGLAQEMLEGATYGCCDCINPKDRRTIRIEIENKTFDSERYRQDLDIADDYLYQSAMAMQPHWITGKPQEVRSPSLDFFTPNERLQLQSIPYPLIPRHLSVVANRQLSMGLIDLLFAYVYDHLLTEGEPTVESAWTISTLSASLSWLDDWLDQKDDDMTVLVQSVVLSSLRRALVYPYLRSWEFSRHCMIQVARILSYGGLRTILRCLLQMRQILDKSELYYLGNKLFVDPYLLWLQQEPTSVAWGYLANAVEHCLNQNDQLLKEDMKLELKQIEALVLVNFVKQDDSTSDSDDSKSESSSSSSTDEEHDDNASSLAAVPQRVKNEAMDVLSQDLVDVESNLNLSSTMFRLLHLDDKGSKIIRNKTDMIEEINSAYNCS